MLWLLLLVFVLMGCPARDNANSTTASHTSTDETITTEEADPTETGTVEYSASAIQYVVDCLQNPTEQGYPPLSATWLVVARLHHVDTADSAESIRIIIDEMVEQAGDRLLPQLAMAWLATSPEVAADYISAKLTDGEYAMLDTLWHKPAIGKTLIAEIDLSALEGRNGLIVIKLLRHWKRTTNKPIDIELLNELAESPDSNIRLQAIGLLIAEGAVNADQRAELRNAVSNPQDLLSAVCEGIMLSGDGDLAEALVPLAVKARMGDLDPEATMQRDPLFAAYALTTLPGKQAQLMRRKLLGAVDPAIRWQARLGELLNGDPSFWDAAVAEHGVEDYGMWVALEPENIANAALLDSYSVVVGESDARLRAITALHLNRYGSIASSEYVVDIITELTADSDVDVRELAWYTAGDLQLASLAEHVIGVIDDTEEPGSVRIAAAYCALRWGESQMLGGNL